MKAAHKPGKTWLERRKVEKGKKKNGDNLKRIILAVLAAAVTVAVITAFFVGRRGSGSETPVTGTPAAKGLVVDTRATDARTEEPGADPLAGRNVYFSGIEDAAISRETVVQLDNREENLDFLLRYEVYDGDGNLVFETGLIPSGQHVDWVPGETLGAGEHTLDFLQIPYHVSGDGELTGLTQGSCRATLAILD